MKKDMGEDRDLTAEWIPVAEAAGMISGTDEDVRRLVRMRRIQWQEAKDTVLLDDVVTVLELREFDAVMDGGGSEKEARRRAEAVRARWEAERNPIENSQLPIDNFQSAARKEESVRFEGLECVSTSQARQILVISTSQLHRLLESRLNSELRGHRRWILKEDVESYACLQKIWSERGGRWTPYGRLEQGANNSTLQPSPPLTLSLSHPVTPSPPHLVTPSPYWLRSQEAAQILNITPWHLHRLAKKRGLTRVRGNRPGPGRPYNRPRGSTPTWFLMDEIARLQEQRDAQGKIISPTEWNHNLRHPVIRTILEAPLNDELIPTVEAARILNVRPLRIYSLVSKGILFGWQKEPGKSGCRLWLSLNQVCRYAQKPERRKCRAAWEKQRRDGKGTLIDWEEHGIDEYYRRLPSKSTKRDRGELFTTRQAAIVMKIGPQTVRMLRERGRLQGFRKPAPKGKAISKRAWWFFKKDEVYNLLADKNYRRDRKEATGVEVDMGQLE